MFPDETSSRQLLQEGGIRPGQLRPFGQLPQELYWREVVQTIDHGRFPSLNVDDFIALALSFWPGNDHLRSLSAAAGRPTTETGALRILCLASGPRDQNRLRLEAEHREIIMATRQSTRPMTAVLHPATRAEDVGLRLIDARPDIAHFGGHGDPSGQLIFEDVDGFSHPVTVEALGVLFGTVKPLRAVVLNSCYSGAYSQALRPASDVVIGSPHPIHDDCALHFARFFYGFLGEGLGLRQAFDTTLAQMQITGCPPHDLRFDGPDGGA